jgi:hypothetical protein
MYTDILAPDPCLEVGSFRRPCVLLEPRAPCAISQGIGRRARPAQVRADTPGTRPFRCSPSGLRARRRAGKLRAIRGAHGRPAIRSAGPRRRMRRDSIEMTMIKVARARRRAALLLLLLASGTAVASPLYDVHVLGLRDAAHTDAATGAREASYRALNGAGFVIGHSRRYGPRPGSYGGWSAWQGTVDGTLRLGLTDAEHTWVDGRQESWAEAQNAAGHVIGGSRRFGEGQGASAWQAIGGTTIRLGLIDDAHTGADDHARSSRAIEQNAAGHVVGLSVRYGVDRAETLGQSVWQARDGVTMQLGLLDEEHAGLANGYRYSVIEGQNEAGDVVGVSDRFGLTGFERLGRSAWQARDGVTVRIGLIDEAHTAASNGYRSASIIEQNEAGQVLGVSVRYGSTYADDRGRSLWQAERGVTTRLGLLDEAHFGTDDGAHVSTAVGQNEAGQVIGTTYRFGATGTEFRGVSAWRAFEGGTVRLGFLDDAHTGAADGYQWSEVLAQNEAGHVVGSSLRFGASAMDGRGTSLWQTVGGTTTLLGLTDAEHTGDADGVRVSEFFAQSASGAVVGASRRFGASADHDLGSSVWQALDGRSRVLGLDDGEHTGTSDGFRSAGFFAQNRAGQVVGSSERYGSGSGDHRGSSVWQSSGGAITRLGLFDPEHTTSSGDFQYSAATAQNEDGQVIGFSVRYGETPWSALGVTPWVARNGTTLRLGPADAAHTADDDGFRLAEVVDHNEAGHIIGFSQRYGVSRWDERGRTAWFHDGASGETHVFDLVLADLGAYLESRFTWLGADGRALGIYRTELNGEYTAFGFDLSLGYFRLDAFLGEDLARGGWASFASLGGFNELGYAVGGAYGPDGALELVLLSPVPEPSTNLAFAVSLLGLTRFRGLRTGVHP